MNIYLTMYLFFYLFLPGNTFTNWGTFLRLLEGIWKLLEFVQFWYSRNITNEKCFMKFKWKEGGWYFWWAKSRTGCRLLYIDVPIKYSAINLYQLLLVVVLSMQQDYVFWRMIIWTYHGYTGFYLSPHSGHKIQATKEILSETIGKAFCDHPN